MTILGLLVKVNDTTIAYTTSAMTWAALKLVKNTSINTIVVLSIPQEFEWVPKFLSLDKLLTAYPTLYKEVTDWTTFLDKIDAISDLQDYFVRTLVPTSCVDKIDGVITIIDTPFFSTMHGTIKYLNLIDDTRLSVTESGNDLVITKELEKPFSSKDTIASSRGVVCYSTYTDSTYVLHHGRHIHNTDNKPLRDISFLDFSELGTLTKYKLSDCEQLFVTGDNNKLYSRVVDTTTISRYMKSAVAFKSYSKTSINVACMLPVGAKAGVPIMCFAGRLFFPGFDKIDLFRRDSDGRYGIIFSINRVILESILSVNLARQNPTTAGIKLEQINLKSFLDNIFTDRSTVTLDPNVDDYTIPHIILLDTPWKLYLEASYQVCNFDNNTILFPKRSQGMLINRLSRDIVHHTHIKYDSKTLITVGSSYKKYLIQNEATNSFITPTLGVGWTNYNEKDNHNPFYKKPVVSLDNLMLLDIGWGDKQEMYTAPVFTPEVDPFVKITLAPCGRLKRIWTVKSPIQPTLEPVSLVLTNDGIDSTIHISFEDITGGYVLESGSASTRIWTRPGTPIVKVTFNEILQAWTIVNGIGEILYQSGLSSSMIEDINITYSDPWDIHLVWYRPINRT